MKSIGLCKGTRRFSDIKAEQKRFISVLQPLPMSMRHARAVATRKIEREEVS